LAVYGLASSILNNPSTISAQLAIIPRNTVKKSNILQQILQLSSKVSSSVINRPIEIGYRGKQYFKTDDCELKKHRRPIESLTNQLLHTLFSQR